MAAKTTRELALEYLRECGAYSDWNGNVEAVMDECGVSRDEAETYVDVWIHENDDMNR